VSLSLDLRAQLVDAARAAALHAYCPYSKFRVGACALSNGQLFSGANIENASYGLTVCAERTAIFKAITEGHKFIDALAVTCLDAGSGSPAAERMCCGACRQVIAEFSHEETLVVVDQVGDFKIGDLLPHAFVLRATS
jgi:cytidine deaminase